MTTIPTLVPPIDPSPGTSDKPEVKTLQADFGDGYTQASRQMNNVRRVVTLKWDVLDAIEATEIIGFLSPLGGTSPFYYRVPGEGAPLLWTCAEWSEQRAVKGYRSISATFRQSFNVVS